MENKLKKHENVCKNYDYGNIEMKKDNKTLEFNHVGKVVKARFPVYADIESLLEKNRHFP